MGGDFHPTEHADGASAYRVTCIGWKVTQVAGRAVTSSEGHFKMILYNQKLGELFLFITENPKP